MRTIFTTGKVQEQFEVDGHVSLPLLTPGEVDALLAEMQRLRPADRFRRREKRPFRPAALTYHCTFLDADVEYKRRTRDLIFGLLAPRVREILVDYDFLNASFYVKPPHSGAFQVHQNWTHLADPSDTTISIWCPLTDADEHNGTLEVVSSSHKVFPDIASPAAPAFFGTFVDTVIEKYLTPIPTKAGDSLFFDDNLIHWSSQNDSPAPRIAIQAIMVPSDAQPVYYHLDPARPDRFELFEIDAEYFVTHTAADLKDIPQERKSLGFVPNANRSLTEAEFGERLAAARAARREGARKSSLMPEQPVRR
jgi:hypothetical protein